MKIQDSVKLIKLAYNPPHIFLWIGYLIYLISNDSIYSEPIIFLKELFLLSLLVIPLSGGIMLINEANDIEEDNIKGKKTPLTQKKIKQDTAIGASIILYLFSIIISLWVSITNKNLSIYFLLVFSIITWWYSDKKYLGKYLKIRLKEHYLTESLAYVISYITYIFFIWSTFKELNSELLITSISFLFLGIFSLFIKDIKDISNDLEAGLKTMASVLDIRTLLKISLLFLGLHMWVFIFSSLFGIFNITYVILIIPFILLLKSVIVFWKNDWKFTKERAKQIETISTSFYLSFIFILIASLSPL